MKQFHGQEKVEPGLYLHSRSFRFESRQEAGTLPGHENETFYRVPPIALLVVGPVLGLAYAIFLPLIGFVMLAKLLVTKISELSRDAARSASRALRPGWQPALASLSRAKQRKAEENEDDEWSREAEELLQDDEESQDD